MRRSLATLLFAALAASAAPAGSAEWCPVGGNLVTAWAAKVDPAGPLPEYPRPTMVRPGWQSLNGLWDCAVTDLDAPAPANYDKKILVPFPIESALSGLKQALTPQERLWYRRAFTAPDLGGGKRLLLHFGAVDWEAVVTINGREIGSHRGGYDPFSFDITDAVTPCAPNELVVRVWDSSGANGEAHGKQKLDAIKNPRGIMYTPCSGIWQTVWLETVPAASIAGLRLTPDVDACTLRLTVAGRGDCPDFRGDAVKMGLSPLVRPESLTVEAVALDGSREVSRACGRPGQPLCLPIPRPRLWSPDDPFLYGLSVSLKSGAAVVDQVESYFGMRKVALGTDRNGVTRLLLNGRFVFQSGPLDQGFWPDGIYTAPTDEALRFDVEVTRRLGFNMTRKHVKVEPERWYYWCDRLGLLVWQDMPSGGAGKGGKKEQDGEPFSAERARQFEAELEAMVASHVNHPSIILWVVFNEGWGQYDTDRLTRRVRDLDPTRLVNSASGWHDRKTGDVADLHAYPGPNCPAREPARAAVLGEFGGLGLGLEGHKWVEKSWGYRGVADPRALTRKFLDLWRQVQCLRDEKGLSAAVYTQITDVETECNGLLTYDRQVVKVDVALSRAAIACGDFPPMPKYKTIVPDAEEQPATWRYTTEKPGDDWFCGAFNDASWKEGPGGFGGGNPPNVTPRTPWTTPDIWVRRAITMPEGQWKELWLRIYHDEDAEVYLNGVLAAKVLGYVTHYEEVPIERAAAAALRRGKNVMAIHCHQTKGGQYIDAGIVELPTAE